MKTYELDLQLEIVKTELEEAREETIESDFWMWNTTDADLNKVRPEEPS